MLDEIAQRGDAELIRRTAAGDRDAFAAFVAKHGGAIHRFLRTVAGHSAEDALQETFLGAWRGAASFREESSPRTWLFTIARNAALRLQRKRVAEPESFESLEDLGAAAGWGDEDPERLLIKRESADLVASALLRLADGDREVLLLRDVEGLSGDEAAAVLGLTVAAMKTRLHRARLRLAAEVRKTYA